MAKAKAKDKTKRSENGRARGKSAKVFERISKEGPEIIREAALLLDE